MQHEFWHERWNTDKIGFHANKAHRFLDDKWGALKLASEDAVFVPLCGKSLDLLWLLERGHAVIGVELSRVAVEAFFKDNHLTPTKSQEGDFTVWTAGPVKLFEGDFFSLKPAHLQEAVAFYDRAALVALPPEMRHRYAQHLKKIIPALKAGLLISFAYHQEEMNGPPFSVPASEIERIYSPEWHIEALVLEDVLNLNPHFQERGLSRLQETVYHVRPA